MYPQPVNMMCSRSLYLAVACFLCCIGSSIGFAPVKTVAGARSTNIQQLESSYRSNQQLLPKHLPGPRQPTLIYSGNPSKSLTSKVNKNKHKIAALAIVLAGIGFTAYPSPCFAASSILSGLTDGERIVVIIAHYVRRDNISFDRFQYLLHTSSSLTFRPLILSSACIPSMYIGNVRTVQKDGHHPTTHLQSVHPNGGSGVCSTWHGVRDG